MKVISSSLGTFHMFEQARQLHRHGLLDQLIAGPPKKFAVERGIPAEKYLSMPDVFAVSYATSKYLSGFDCVTKPLTRLCHDTFSRRLARKIPKDADVFIGLSSYCEEAIAAANDRGIVTVVDHGSLHECFAKMQLEMEQEKFGFRLIGNPTNPWLIEKQDREFQSANKVLALSNLAKATLAEAGVDKDKIVVNHLGVSLDRFGVRAKEDQVFRVVYCGQVNPGKGVHYLVDAFNKLNMSSAELLIIGSLKALGQDDRFGTYFRERAGHNVHFLGPVDSQRVAYLFSQSSVFVMPSLADGFGMVVTQAMACGLPVIVSDHTGASELLVDGKNGFVTPARDVDALHRRLSQLAEDQRYAREMGLAAVEAVKSGLTWDDYGNRLASTIREIA